MSPRLAFSMPPNSRTTTARISISADWRFRCRIEPSTGGAAKQQRQIDAVIFVACCEIRGARAGKQPRFEQDRAVLAVGHDQAVGRLLVQESRDRGHVRIVAWHLPR